MLTLKQRAYQYIRQAMSDGVLTAGDRLSPAALAKEIGISHIPVREAISQLYSEGLVDQLPRRGAFVRRPGREELTELIELRKVLECNAAAQAARRIGDVELAELEQRLADLDEVRNTQSRLSRVDGHGNGDGQSDVAGCKDEEFIDLLAKWLIIDLEFHMVILRAARNRWVLKVLEDTSVMTRMFSQRTDRPENWSDAAAFSKENYDVHAAIVEAICNHDPKASRKAMAVHMRRARRNMLARYDWLISQSDPNSSFAKEFSEAVRRQILQIQESSQPAMPMPGDIDKVE
ncbi:MAG: GntR family transcriptional regulator [Pirellulales bacterium]|nr:GntR family transcriptional regulator [Pirellulales bacterium]